MSTVALPPRLRTRAGAKTAAASISATNVASIRLGKYPIQRSTPPERPIRIGAFAKRSVGRTSPRSCRTSRLHLLGSDASFGKPVCQLLHDRHDSMEAQCQRRERMQCVRPLLQIARGKTNAYRWHILIAPPYSLLTGQSTDDIEERRHSNAQA